MVKELTNSFMGKNWEPRTRPTKIKPTDFLTKEQGNPMKKEQCFQNLIQEQVDIHMPKINLDTDLTPSQKLTENGPQT